MARGISLNEAGYVLMDQPPPEPMRGRCQAHATHPIKDTPPLTCQLLAGHEGMHHDCGCDWSEGEFEAALEQFRKRYIANITPDLLSNLEQAQGFIEEAFFQGWLARMGEAICQQ